MTYQHGVFKAHPTVPAKRIMRPKEDGKEPGSQCSVVAMAIAVFPDVVDRTSVQNQLNEQHTTSKKVHCSGGELAILLIVSESEYGRVAHFHGWQGLDT